MQYYDDDNGRGSRRAGAIAAVAYIVLWVVLMLVVNISLKVKETGEGILMAFGDTEQAGGTISASRPQPANDQSPADNRTPVTDTEDIMTQDTEDAPAVTPQQQQQTAPPVEEQPRVPDPNALFPGNRQSGSTSQGTTEGEGRQGSQDGTPGADPAGTGAGEGSTGFSLAGRSLVGSLPTPRYGPNKSGRVVVDITVDAEGRVIRAVPRGHGSTTNDSELVKAAMDAATEARFNVVEGNRLQTGTVTYNFILK